MGKQNIPQLRFPEFEGDWIKIDGEIVFKSISNKDHKSDLPILAITQEYGAIPRDLIGFKISVTDKSIETYKVVEKGDFIISLRTFQGGIEYSNYTGICSPAYIILRPITEIDNHFFKYYFKTDRYIQSLNKKLEGIRDGKMISFKYFSEATLTYPTLPEQIHISAFFTVLDKKITELKQKKTLLERYKKGVTQKLLSQELRFKDENGKEFPDWKKKKLGDIANIRSGLSIDQNGDKEGYKVTRIETISDGKINLNKIGFIKANDKIDNYKLTKGDILFSNINSVSQIGKTAIVCSDLDLYHGMNLLCLKSFVNIDSFYLFYYLNTDAMRNYFKQICNQAVSQASINQTELAKTQISLPCINEQTRIANFLSTLDEKIDHTRTQILQTEQYKKGLLQNMFC